MDRFGALQIVGLSIAGQVAALLLLGGLARDLSGVHRLPGPICRRRNGHGPALFRPDDQGAIRPRARLYARHRGMRLRQYGRRSADRPSWSTQRVGWRFTYVAAAALVLVLGTAGAPLVRSEGVPDRPAARLRQGGVAENELRHLLFWILVAGFMVSALFSNGYLLHLILLLGERGFAPGNAAPTQAVIGVAMLVGRISTGLALDRFAALLVASVTFGICGLGCALLLQTEPALVVLATLAIGLAIGAELDLLLHFVSLLWPGAVRTPLRAGLRMLLISVGASPILIKFLAASDEYSFALAVSAGGILIGATMLFFLPNRRKCKWHTASESLPPRRCGDGRLTNKRVSPRPIDQAASKRCRINGRPLGLAVEARRLVCLHLFSEKCSLYVWPVASEYDVTQIRHGPQRPHGRRPTCQRGVISEAPQQGVELGARPLPTIKWRLTPTFRCSRPC